MNLYEEIREYVKSPDTGSKDYGKWGALNREQRKLINKLCDFAESCDKIIKEDMRRTDELEEEKMELEYRRNDRVVYKGKEAFILQVDSFPTTTPYQIYFDDLSKWVSGDEIKPFKERRDYDDNVNNAIIFLRENLLNEKDSREKSMCLTKLDELEMWYLKSLGGDKND